MPGEAVLIISRANGHSGRYWQSMQEERGDARGRVYRGAEKNWIGETSLWRLPR